MNFVIDGNYLLNRSHEHFHREIIEKNNFEKLKQFILTCSKMKYFNLFQNISFKNKIKLILKG